MLTRVQKTALTVLVLMVFFGGGLFLVVKNRFFFTAQPAPSVFSPEIPPELEKELRLSLERYLDAYKNAKEKKNYEELKEFLSQDVAGNFSAQWLTDIDDYKIEQILRPAFLMSHKEEYQARVKIFKNNQIINPPSGEDWPVWIVREGEKFKVKTYFFTLPM